MELARSAMEWLRRRPAVADALLAAALGSAFLAASLLAPHGLRDNGHIDLGLSAPGVVLTVLAALALTQRRRRPVGTVAVLTAVTAASMIGVWGAPLAPVGLTIAGYSYVVRAPRARALALVGVATLALVLTGVVSGLWQGEWGEFDQIVLWLWLATAIASAIQARRAVISALQDRARRAEESREETARRRVAEDRVRIARELHDVIAHHVAVMSVQSGVAEHLVERDPAGAREALHHVREAGRAVLAELQSLLGVLRQDESALPTAPVPGISGLDGLVASFRAMGTCVETKFQPLPRALPPAADVAAFRLVQEALTNVEKHASGAAVEVAIETEGPVVVIEVTNSQPPCRPAAPNGGVPDAASREPSAGSGLGLIGMRERVVAAGGSLETGPTADGGFRVTARLPLSREDR